MNPEVVKKLASGAKLKCKSKLKLWQAL